MTGLVSEKVFAVPKGANPVLICGLPGSGYVGKLAADHLIRSFELKKVAEYNSATFPPR